MKGIVSFYGKPGCIGNNRQKESLREAGFALQEVDMINKVWEAEELCRFFNGRSPSEFINDRAPRIKSGEFDPKDYSDDQLLQEMVKDPYLIKRPLIFYRGQFACGIESPLVCELLGSPQKQRECDGNGEACL